MKQNGIIQEATAIMPLFIITQKTLLCKLSHYILAYITDCQVNFWSICTGGAVPPDKVQQSMPVRFIKLLQSVHSGTVGLSS